MSKILYFVILFFGYSVAFFNANWENVGNGIQNHNANLLEDQISRSNVNFTQLLWKIDFPVVPGAPYPPSLDAQPAYYQGMLYFGDSLGVIYSVYADNGSVFWKTNVSVGNDVGTIELFQTTPFVEDENVYLAARNIFCLDRENGQVIWKKSLSGDTTSVGPDGRNTDYYSYAGDIGIIGRRLIVGVASVQNRITEAELVNPANRDLTARGGVVCLNKFTGATLWRFHTTSNQLAPSPTYGAGASVWTSPGIDILTRTVYFGVGQAFEPPASPYTDSIIAINYDTGVLRWYKQFVADDVYGRLHPGGPDFDVSTHPNIFTIVATLPGDLFPKIHRLVGVGSKDGNYYLFKTRQSGTEGNILATVNADPGSLLGGFQATPAYYRGVLYMSTHASVINNTRVPVDVTNFVSYSTKTIAVDVEKLLEGDPYILWNNTEAPGLLRLAFGPTNYANDIIFQASVGGYVKGLDKDTGKELFRRVPSPSTMELAPGFFANAPCYGGTTITDGKFFVAFGSSYNIFTKGGLACYGFLE